jgi:hypothetical protein
MRFSLYRRTILLFALIHSMSLSTFGELRNEYELKAQYLCLLAKYIQYTNKPPVEYNIGVIGDNPFQGNLKKYDGQAINGKRINIHFFGTNVDDAVNAKCQIIFISKSEQLAQKKLIQMVSSPETLTVADNSGFLLAGGLLNFHIVDNKLRIEYNHNLLKSKDFKISSATIKATEDKK